MTVAAPSLGRRLLAVVVLSACVGLIGGASAAWALYHRLGPSERTVTTVSTQPGGGGGGAGQPVTLDSIATDRSPSIVKVVTQPVDVAGLLAGPAGFASGFVASRDGLVVTSAHAVANATQLRIATADGRVYDALLAATDPVHGLAVLRAVGATSLTPIAFADRAARIGDAAIAIGWPVFASISVSSGTVASTGRSILEGSGGRMQMLLDAFTVTTLADTQADGGPVLDGTGTRVLGVITGGSHPDVPGTVALGGRDAAALVDRAGRAGGASHGSFGAETVLLDPATAAAAGLPLQGALVRSVDPAGPAVGKLQPGDVVTQVDGQAVDSQHPFDPAGFSLDPGQLVTLTLSRGGAPLTVRLTVAA